MNAAEAAHDPDGNRERYHIATAPHIMRRTAATTQKRARYRTMCHYLSISYKKTIVRERRHDYCESAGTRRALPSGRPHFETGQRQLGETLPLRTSCPCLRLTQLGRHSTQSHCAPLHGDVAGMVAAHIGRLDSFAGALGTTAPTGRRSRCAQCAPTRGTFMKAISSKCIRAGGTIALVTLLSLLIAPANAQQDTTQLTIEQARAASTLYAVTTRRSAAAVSATSGAAHHGTPRSHRDSTAQWR